MKKPQSGCTCCQFESGSRCSRCCGRKKKCPALTRTLRTITGALYGRGLLSLAKSRFIGIPSRREPTRGSPTKSSGFITVSQVIFLAVPVTCVGRKGPENVEEVFRPPLGGVAGDFEWLNKLCYCAFKSTGIPIIGQQKTRRSKLRHYTPLALYFLLFTLYFSLYSLPEPQDTQSEYHCSDYRQG